MNIKEISRLHKELTFGLSTEEMSHKELLTWATSLLTQYRQAKSIIRNLTVDDEPGELEHWELIKSFTYSEIDNVLKELYQRSITEEETFEPAIAIKFADTVAKIRATCYDEIRKDREASKAEPEEEVVLILE